MAKNDYSKHMLGLVAVVAIIGIFLMVYMPSGINNTTCKEEYPAVDETTDLAGQAIDKVAYQACLKEKKVEVCQPEFNTCKAECKPEYQQCIKDFRPECRKASRIVIPKNETPKPKICTPNEVKTDCLNLNGVDYTDKPWRFEHVCSADGTSFTTNSIKCTEGLCNSGKCVVAEVDTCTPGPTGKYKCEQPYSSSGPWYASPEIKDTDCTSSYGKQIYCGYHEDSCLEDYGCCELQLITNECQGDVIHNVTKNLCTGETKEKNIDCTKNGFVDKMNMTLTCVKTNDGSSICGSGCTIGDVMYKCESSKVYTKYTCTQGSYYVDWDPGSYPYTKVDTCPEGASCYDPKGYGCTF